jgi:hypothetical protein
VAAKGAVWAAAKRTTQAQWEPAEAGVIFFARGVMSSGQLFWDWSRACLRDARLTLADDLHRSSPTCGDGGTVKQGTCQTLRVEDHQKVVANLGRLDILQTSGGLGQLISSLAWYAERCCLEAEGQGNLAWAKCYGPVPIFPPLWENLGLDKQVTRLARDNRVEFLVDEAALLRQSMAMANGTSRASLRGLPCRVSSSTFQSAA